MRLTKFLKRQVSKMLCVALLLSTVAVTGERQVAEAASKTEIEANGTVLTLNEVATGELTESDEQDWYIFDITKRGYFTVDLKRNDSADTDKINYGWKCSLYHEDDIVNAIFSESSITNSYEGKELPLPEGRYYICVGASDGHWGPPLDCPYDVIVNFTESEDWEQEYNDTNATPNIIEINKTYLGDFHNSADTDWYKVTTLGNGTIQLDFGPDASTNADDIGYGWKVTILDGELNTIREYTTKVKLLSQILPFEKGTFYIRVDSVDGHWGPPLNCIYNLKLNFIPETDWETEYNNEYATANTITSGNECHGVLSWNYDEDWYRIDNETDVTAALKFRVDDSVSVDDIGYGWKIVVYNADRELITEMVDVKRTTVEEEIQLPKGAAYVKVCIDDSWGMPVDCIYHLTVTTTPVKAPDTTSNPSETPDNTSTPDNTAKPDDTSKPSNTSKPNTTNKPNSSTATSKPSTTNQPNSTSNEVMEKAIAGSKVTTSTVTSKKKKSVYLRWKKQKYAGGYEIYRSTKKKNGYKKVKTIKGSSKVSWTDKNVKGGKTYYYKIRAYRKINGKKTVSGFSKAKRVKVKK